MSQRPNPGQTGWCRSSYSISGGDNCAKTGSQARRAGRRVSKNRPADNAPSGVLVDVLRALGGFRTPGKRF